MDEREARGFRGRIGLVAPDEVRTQIGDIEAGSRTPSVRMMNRHRNVLALLLLGPLALGAQAAAQLPVCGSCSIRLSKVRTLGTNDGPGMITTPSRSVILDRQGRVHVVAFDELARRYAAQGNDVRVYGRRGRGPGDL